MNKGWYTDRSKRDRRLVGLPPGPWGPDRIIPWCLEVDRSPSLGLGEVPVVFVAKSQDKLVYP